MAISKPITPKPFPLDQNGYTQDLSDDSHTQAAIEKALDNRKVPATLSAVVNALSALNTKVADTNTLLANTNTLLTNTNTLLTDIKTILNDHFNPPAEE